MFFIINLNMKKLNSTIYFRNTVSFIVFTVFFAGITVSCTQHKTRELKSTEPQIEETTENKSPEAPLEAYQNRSPEQLLELVALRHIEKLKPGEFRRGTWDDVKHSKPPVGAWFGYPQGVLLLGMQYTNRVLDNKELHDYVNDYIKVATDDYNYLVWQRNEFGKVHLKGDYFRRLFRMNMLDDCGAASASMLEAVLNNGAYKTNELKVYLNNAGYFITKTHWRLKNGTLWRPVSPGSRPMSIWADDSYMSCPFLVRWAEYKNDTTYLNDAVRQIINFASYLQDDDGVWWHAYLVDEDRPAKFKWGRANGWAMMATVEVLSAMPEDHPQREEVLSILQKHIEGIKNYQSESGLWYQVIDHPELNWGVETSCSAMFTYAISRAINRGWIDKSNIEVVRRSVNGLNKKIEADGAILGVCRSASIGSDLKYYETRPTRVDDQHGWGATLMALSEYIIAEQNIEGSK